MSNLYKILYIGFFGILGVYSRYFIQLFIERHFRSTFPYGTFLINITGSFFVGLIYILGVERSLMSVELRTGIMVGLIGGYTTFSSYSLEISSLLKEGEYIYAVLYFTLSSLIGVMCVFAGMYLGKSVT